MTPEGRVKAAVNKILTGASAYRHCPISNGMGSPALDYHVCHRGHYAAIEAKAKGGHPTPRQTRTMRQVVEHGGSLFLIDAPFGNDMATLQGWLLQPVPGFISPLARAWLASSESKKEII